MNELTIKTPATARREIPHTISPGLWTLAWRRLRTDSIAMVSLAIVAAFLLLMLLSGIGVVAKDWAREIGINYAPPSFLGPDAAPGRRFGSPEAVALYRLNALDANVKGVLEHGLAP